MSQPDVSVIIPFYKVAPFIGRCTTALMEQTASDVEFIFVDDASPDDSRQILETVLAHYPERDTRIVTHPVNHGLPAARNTGLAQARGRYIWHCDSDDWPEVTMLEKMLAVAKQADADIVYCDFFLSFETGERYMSNPSFSTGEELLKKGFLAGSTKYNVWNKLIRKELYDRTGFRFPAGHGMGEDMTVIMLTTAADKVAHVKEALYHYVKLNSNAFSNTFSQKHLDDIRFNAARTITCLEENGISEKDIALFKLNTKLPFLFSENKSQYPLWKEWYPEANRFVLDNSNLPFRTKLVQWLAGKDQFWAVNLYSRLIISVYRFKYR
jgi:Glycosyltransferases involved in cell wall biogenesis